MLFGFGRKKDVSFSDDELVGSFIPKKPLKVGHNLKVPEGRVCYLCYRDTVYYSLPAGDYALNYDSVPKLLQRQEKSSIFSSKKDKKVAKFTADMFFVKDKESGRMEFSFNWKKFVFDDKSKDKLDVNMVLYWELTDHRAFLDALLSEVAIIEPTQAKRMLTLWLKDDCKEYIYLNPLRNMTANFDEKYVAEFVKYLNKEYKPIGINITGIELSMGGKRAFEPKTIELPSINDIQAQNPNLRAENLPRVADRQVDISQGNTAVATEPRQNIQDSQKRYCPRCQTEIVGGAVYCHKCGMRV